MYWVLVNRGFALRGYQALAKAKISHVVTTGNKNLSIGVDTRYLSLQVSFNAYGAEGHVATVDDDPGCLKFALISKNLQKILREKISPFLSSNMIIAAYIIWA